MRSHSNSLAVAAEGRRILEAQFLSSDQFSTGRDIFPSIIAAPTETLLVARKQTHRSFASRPCCCHSIVLAEQICQGILQFMLSGRGVQPFLSFILVVATTIGFVLPTQACHCATPTRINSSSSTDSPTAPQVSAAPAPKPCCNRPCCKVNRHAESPGCCCEVQPAPPETQESTSKQVGVSGRACEAAGCDCGLPEIPPTPPTPSTTISDATDFAHVESFFPPEFLPTPAATSQTVIGPVPRPPSNLIISLARLTC